MNSVAWTFKNPDHMYTRRYREGLGSGNPLELQNFNVEEVQWNFVEMHCPLDQ